MSTTTFEPIPNLFNRIDLRMLYPGHENELPVMAYCPFHGDTDRPNLAVYPANTYCFACGVGETAFEHIERVRKTHNKREVFSVIATILDTKPRPAQAKHNGVQPIDMGVVNYYRKSLSTDKLVWLQRKYGLSQKTIEEAYIGYAGIAYSLPVFDLSGRVMNIRFRRDDDVAPTKPKYWGVPGHNNSQWYFPPNIRQDITSSTLASILAQEKGNTKLFLFEGEYDALAAYEYGLMAISSTNGAQALLSKKGEEELDVLMGCYIYICYDQDEPGREAGRSLLHKLRERGLVASRLLWPEHMGKDFSELLAKGFSLEQIREYSSFETVS